LQSIQETSGIYTVWSLGSCPLCYHNTSWYLYGFEQQHWAKTSSLPSFIPVTMRSNRNNMKFRIWRLSQWPELV